ncbi:hypothetical protein P691DRAFT_687850, partial [Macrolepiota fuliginosa MF-IS2]
GIGKTAIAQTVAEEFRASDRLGASLFFSVKNLRDNPNEVIPTLVYQLALTYPKSKSLVIKRLSAGRTILERFYRCNSRNSL